MAINPLFKSLSPLLILESKKSNHFYGRLYFNGLDKLNIDLVLGFAEREIV